MKLKNLLSGLDGFIWEAIKGVTPDLFLEPYEEILPIDEVLGPMTDLEKSILAVEDGVFENIILIFGLQEESEECISDFYGWLISASRDEFISECRETPGVDEFDALCFRNHFFAACNLLRFISIQRFNLISDDYVLFYRKGFIVTKQRLKLNFIDHINEN
jgi:hypothetical protein